MIVDLLLAVIAAAGLSVALIVRQPPDSRLKDPSLVPGMPMAGPASMQAAHAAITRKRR